MKCFLGALALVLGQSLLAYCLPAAERTGGELQNAVSPDKDCLVEEGERNSSFKNRRAGRVNAPVVGFTGAFTRPARRVFQTTGKLPTVRFVSKSPLQLRFKVATKDQTNVGRVDFYVTKDDGKTWASLKNMLVTWLPREEEKETESLPARVDLPLAEEGVIYGFTIVPRSNKARPVEDGPKPGDVPDIRIELDKTLPVGQIYSPQPHPRRRDTVILSWKVSDRNLHDRPISLSWAKEVEGPWKAIGSEWMANTGRYDWKVPHKLPKEIYLRLLIRDEAGNTAVAQTSKPIALDFHELETPLHVKDVAGGQPAKERDKKMDTRIFELRTYTAAPGKLDALNARFRNHTNKLFEKHGMTIIGFWMPAPQKEDEEKLIYILAYPSKDAADKSWKAFREDPEWQKVVAESEKNGRLLAKPPESVYMKPTDYSPLK